MSQIICSLKDYDLASVSNIADLALVDDQIM